MALASVDYFFLTHSPAPLADSAAIGKLFDNVVSAHHHIRRMLVRTSQSPHDRIYTQLIIAIDEQYILAGSSVQTSVTCFGHSFTGLMNHTNTLITLRGRITEFRRSVRRPIINQYDVKLRVDLRAQAIHTSIEVILRVPHRHDNAY